MTLACLWVEIVVANDVKLQLGGDFLIDLAQEGEPLLMAMARGGVGEHLAGKVVQGGKEGHRSVPVVVVGPGANVSLAQRQSGLGAFQGLTLALFIAAEHQGLLGRIEVEAHHVPKLFLKLKVLGELEIAHPVGLQLMGRPESLHARFAQVGLALPGYAPYAATKSAVETLTNIFAKELRGRGISVNAVAPGPTATDLFFNGKTPEQIAHMSKMAPLERLGRPEDIAGVVSFLVGPDGAWVNGQTLRANGGIV